MTRRARRKPEAQAGFTLLEVMVAIAILAISLAALFSTEAGSIRMASRARKMGFATLLARCKMGEIEEEIALKGMPALFASGSDECCVDGEIDGFECKWELDPIIMPESMFGDPDAQDPLAAASGAAVPPAGLPPGAMPPANRPPTDAITGGPSEILNGGGDVDGMASMAMQLVYPVLKPAFESQVRRASVTVSWHEGSTERSFEVTQYLVAEQPAGILQGIDEAANGGDPAQQPQGQPQP